MTLYDQLTAIAQIVTRRLEMLDMAQEQAAAEKEAA